MDTDTGTTTTSPLRPRTTHPDAFRAAANAAARHPPAHPSCSLILIRTCSFRASPLVAGAPVY